MISGPEDGIALLRYAEVHSIVHGDAKVQSQCKAIQGIRVPHLKLEVE
jgi:hypothetical protein